MNISQKIKELATAFLDDTIQIRRYLHQHPELSFQEHHTSAFIKQKLDELGIPYTGGYVETGILAKIEGLNPQKKIVALRADMDALPVVEENQVDYISQNTGVMHACGHDVHSACLLGAAKILQQFRNDFEGTILLVFQPAEEKLPGGAKLMLEQGIFDAIKPDLIIGQHVMPGLQVGKVGFRSGMYMASADEIYLTVKGKGGHAAMPHQLVDTVLVASHIIVALQQVVSRNAYAAIPSVLSFGKVDAPGATNIIPREVKIEGTFRTMDEKWRYEAHQKITKIATTLAESMGATCEVDIEVGYPCLVNDAGITTEASKLAMEILGKEQVVELDLRMTSEDFAFFSQQYPATFYRLGISGAEAKVVSPLHSPTFNIDEKALETGMATMAYLALGFLKNESKY
ncbi:MAG: amidohydrolase [Bacteroidota bacterium]|nr:MAG: amidohydrolase [Bacteroidota bacterium]